MEGVKTDIEEERVWPLLGVGCDQSWASLTYVHAESLGAKVSREEHFNPMPGFSEKRNGLVKTRSTR